MGLEQAMNAINRRDPHGSTLGLNTILLIIFGALFLFSGCKAAPTWSAESRSPDGRMVATAEVFTNGGFVAPGPSTTLVHLKGTSGSQKPMLVFAFSAGLPSEMQVKMSWASPTHLDLVYKGRHTIDFEAIKYAGVDISVRCMSAERAGADLLRSAAKGRVNNPDGKR